MYVCMYVCMYTQKSACTSIFLSLSVSMCRSISLSIPACTCTQIPMHLHVAWGYGWEESAVVLALNQYTQTAYLGQETVWGLGLVSRLQEEQKPQHLNATNSKLSDPLQAENSTVGTIRPPTLNTPAKRPRYPE